MQEKYRRQMVQCFDELGAGGQVDHYVELFPELDSRLVKFAAGILGWNMSGLIDIDNPDDVSRVRLMLKVIGQTPACDFFDNTFNGADPDTVCSIIGMRPGATADEHKQEFNYSVHHIDSYQDAHEYLESVSWCIVISEESYKAYTANGNRFYFCGNGDWQNVPCVPGTGFPRDRFGYSLIAVEVTPGNKIASITSRWNTCAGDTDDFITEDELKAVLGDKNFGKLLCKSDDNN